MSFNQSQVTSRTFPGTPKARELPFAAKEGRSESLPDSNLMGMLFHCLRSCRFGHVFMWDAGSSVGEITGHSKFINSIDFKPCRPYRIVTAGEDNAICWFEGPPFKYKKVIREHTRFVNTIRFSPNGEKACSGGADGVVG